MMRRKLLLPVFVFVSSVFLCCFPVFAADTEDDVVADSESPFGKHLREENPLLTEYTKDHAGYVQMREDLKLATDAKRVALEEKIYERAKQMLSNRISRLIEYSERLNARVDVQEVLTEEEVATLQSLIADFEVRMNDHLSGVDAAETIEDLRAINAEITANGVPALNALRVRFVVVNVHRGTVVVGRIRERLEKVKMHLDAAAAVGNDVSTAEVSYDKCLESLDKAESKYSEVLQALEAITDSDDPAVAVVSLREMLQEANGYVRSAFNNLKEAVSHLILLHKDTPWSVSE
jgi:prefoldin subunit 5